MVKHLDQDLLANDSQKPKSQIPVKKLNALLEEEGKANTHILSIPNLREKTNKQPEAILSLWLLKFFFWDCGEKFTFPSPGHLCDMLFIYIQRSAEKINMLEFSMLGLGIMTRKWRAHSSHSPFADL